MIYIKSEDAARRARLSCPPSRTRPSQPGAGRPSVPPPWFAPPDAEGLDGPGAEDAKVVPSCQAHGSDPNQGGDKSARQSLATVQLAGSGTYHPSHIVPHTMLP